MKAIALAAGILLSLTGVNWGQTADTPVGVLLGLRLGASSDDQSEHPVPSRYRTLWIVKTGQSIRVAASAPLLLVPRRQGFWRVGSTTVDLSNSYSEELLWASATRGKPIRVHDDASASCQGRSYTQVEFIAGDYLAYAGGSTSRCNGSNNEWFSPYVRRIDQFRDRVVEVETSVDISEVFGPRGVATLREAASSLAHKIVEDIPDNPSPADLAEWERALADPMEYQWGLRRSLGELEVFGYVRAARDDFYTAVLPLPLPQASFGKQSGALSLTDVGAAVPSSTDAFSSPSGDLVVVVTRLEVLAFLPRVTGFTEPALRVSLGGDFDSGDDTWWGTSRGTAAVMAEWASGQYVSKWTNAMREFSRQPSPKVEVDRRGARSGL